MRLNCISNKYASFFIDGGGGIEALQVFRHTVGERFLRCRLIYEPTILAKLSVKPGRKSISLRRSKRWGFRLIYHSAVFPLLFGKLSDMVHMIRPLHRRRTGKHAERPRCGERRGLFCCVRSGGRGGSLATLRIAGMGEMR